MKVYLLSTLMFAVFFIASATNEANENELSNIVSEQEEKHTNDKDSKEETSEKDGATFDIKFGKGISVKNAEKTVGLTLKGRVQSRLFVAHPYTDGRNAEIGAQIKRARFKIEGFTKLQSQRKEEKLHWLEYKMQLGLSNGDIGGVADGKGLILDAYIMYHVNDKFDIWFGQTKLPGNLEYTISSSKQSFADRSLTSTFRPDRDFGIQIHADLGDKNKTGEKIVFRPAASVSLGEGRNIKSASMNGLDYTFRAELLPLGKFSKDNTDKVGGGFKYFFADMVREQKPKLSLSMVYDFNHNAMYSRGQRRGTEVDAANRTSIHTVFANAFMKYKGWTFFGEYVHRSVNSDYLSYYDTGNAVTAQASYICKKNFEIAARFSRITPLDNLDLDKSLKMGENHYSIAFSKYFIGHNLKIQTDYTFKDEINSGTGIDEGEWRIQMEIQF